MSVFDRFRPKNEEQTQQPQQVAATQTQKRNDQEEVRRQAEADRAKAGEDRKLARGPLERAIKDDDFRARIWQEIENPGVRKPGQDPQEPDQPQRQRTAEQMKLQPEGLQRGPSPGGDNYTPPHIRRQPTPEGQQGTGRLPDRATPPSVPEQDPARILSLAEQTRQARSARAAKEEAERVRFAALTPEQRSAETEERIVKNIRTKEAYDGLDAQLRDARRKPWER